jgi:putative radical SAM enzyme (TIGR03279 family)
MSDLTIKPALITNIEPDSIADELGFEIGDRLVSINHQKPRDLIDYKFFCADEFLELEVLDPKGKTHIVELEKDYDEDLGLEFETALFDGLIQCNNKCPFCFIDQQPPGKRKSLYFKDDDYRLSFLYGSYLTLTNLTQKEWDRIAQMRLSPLYVSVHATTPEVRIRLLKNQRAELILDQLKWFKKHRLQIHAQVVVCPGINDGEILEKTLLDLASFHTGETPAVLSVAVVPVGLTKFRPQEDELIPVTAEKAQEVILQVKEIQAKLSTKTTNKRQNKIKNSQANCIWLADEWFLIAGEELPSEKDYADYPQIGNGVGSIRQFISQFEQLAEKLLPPKIDHQKTLTWVVGNAVEKAFQPIVKRLNTVEGLTVKMEAIASEYWGQTMTVTGLLTGEDILKSLENKQIGDGILLPSVMLKHDEAKFLDDLTISELAKKLNTEILIVNGVEELITKALY